ncbi:MAG: MoaD/ThiS family protein [Candidatus Hodarchaeales archaeon]
MPLIQVKLFGTLRDRGPKGLDIGEAFSMKIDPSTDFNQLLEQLEIATEEAKIIMRNHVTIKALDEILEDNDEIAIFPPIGGG